NAASKRQCRQQCAPRIASCIADGTKPRRCRTTIIKTCRRRGLQTCVVGAPTPPPTLPPPTLPPATLPPPPTSQTGSLSVHVIDPFGGAIAGANVQLTGREGTRTLQTGSDGSASASDIAAGSTTVRAVRDGFDPGRQDVVVQPAQVANVRLTLQPQS